MPSVMLPMPETSCRAFSRSNLRSFLASLRVALTARLFSFRSGVRFAISKEYQHFRVPADCARLARVACQPNAPSAQRCVTANPAMEMEESKSSM
jgi:hypothetical protein